MFGVLYIVLHSGPWRSPQRKTAPRPNMTLCKEVGEWPILGPGPHDRQRPAWGQTHTPHPPHFRPFPTKPTPFHPHPLLPCHNRLTPAAGWIANVSMQVGGNASCSGAQTSAWLAGGGEGQRGSAGGRPFQGTCKASHRAGVPVPASRVGADHRCGPVADMARLRQGPCRNTRPKQLPRPVQAAAGATRAEGPEEGQVDKPAPCVCEASACRMGTPSGDIRAARCQRHPNTNYLT